MFAPTSKLAFQFFGLTAVMVLGGVAVIGGGGATGVVTTTLLVGGFGVTFSASDGSRRSMADSGTDSSLIQVVLMTMFELLSDTICPSNRSPFFSRRMTFVCAKAGKASIQANARIHNVRSPRCSIVLRDFWRR